MGDGGIVDVFSVNPQIRGANYMDLHRLSVGPRYNYGYQIFYVFDGRGTGVINERRFELCPGTLALYGPGDRHFFSSEGKAIKAGTIYFSWIPVEERKLAMENGAALVCDREFWEFADDLMNLEGLPDIPFVIELSGEYRPSFEAIIKTIGQTYLKVDNSLTLRHKSLFLELLSILSDVHKIRGASGRNSKIQAFKGYLQRHYASDINRKKVSKAIGISESYLTTLLKKELDINFTSFLTELRLKKAMELILYSDFLIKEIADKTGFKDVAYFIRQFRKKYGYSPKQCRKS